LAYIAGWFVRIAAGRTPASRFTPLHLPGDPLPEKPESAMAATTLKSKAAEAAAYLRSMAAARPSTGILTGTGLGEIATTMRAPAIFDYADIPHFPRPTVAGHSGRLAIGDIGGNPVMLFQGRLHLYEGYSPEQVTFPVRVMQELGVGSLIVTNAAGGLNPAFAPGDIMLITDHINLTGDNPLAGPNEDGWGPRFPDMTAAYDPGMIAAAQRAAAAAGIPVHRGVYAGLRGPSLETPAESRYLKIIGAAAVGFSTVHEVITAVHGGMTVLGASIITNVNDPDRPVPATLEDIIAVARRATPALERLLRRLMGELKDETPPR
jgi:purine-nucleoside phosphorylase